MMDAREINPQHDVLCPKGHVIFKWMAFNSYKVLGYYGIKYHTESYRSFYSCPICGDIDVEKYNLPIFRSCVFDGSDMPQS